MLRTKYATRIRRTYLLSPFQSKFALTFVLLSAFPVLLTLFLIYRFVRGSGGAIAIVNLLYAGSNNSWLAGAVLVLFSSFVLLFSATTLMLHRIAGPIQIMTRYMAELAEGRYPAIRPLRTKDELVDFYLTLKWMAERLRQRELDESVAIQNALEVLGQLRPSGRYDDLASTLKAILERKLKISGEPSAHSHHEVRPLELATGSRAAGDVETKILEE